MIRRFAQHKEPMMNTQLFGGRYHKISMAPHVDIDKIARCAGLACAFVDFEVEPAAGRTPLRKLVTMLSRCFKASILLAQRVVSRHRI